MRELTLGSLFAGIGGIDLGFERAGFKTLWQVEFNPYCRRVLEKNFPDANRDVIDVRDAGRHNLCAVDVLAGGFPCQDISAAGLRAGIDEGKRSGLWSEYKRIISELRPRIVFVENVAALLYPIKRNGRVAGPAPIARVVGDLAALGYDAEWHVVSAADVGAPHLRERVWIVAYAHSQSKQESMQLDSPIGSEWFARLVAERGIDRCGKRESGSAMADPDGSGCAGARPAQPAEWRCCALPVGQSQDASRANGNIGGYWSTEPNVGRVAYGIPAGVDRLRALGNAVVPQVVELIAHGIRQSLTVPCPLCEGWGMYGGKDCPQCGGDGKAVSNG